MYNYCRTCNTYTPFRPMSSTGKTMFLCGRCMEYSISGMDVSDETMILLLRSSFDGPTGFVIKGKLHKCIFP